MSEVMEMKILDSRLFQRRPPGSVKTLDRSANNPAENMVGVQNSLRFFIGWFLGSYYQKFLKCENQNLILQAVSD
jgi:hypothetical protein